MRMIAQNTSSATTAWFTLAGALGGVLITSSVALVTVILNHRWQRETKDQELITKQSNELRRTRREIYVRYFTTESSLVLVGAEVRVGGKAVVLMQPQAVLPSYMKP